MRIANVAIRGMNKYGTKVRDWLQDRGLRRPDIVTLQKIGLNEEFPKEELLEVGYESRCVGSRAGQYPTGVAILSHRSLGRPDVLFRGFPDDEEEVSDFLTVDLGGFWVSSVYVPYPLQRRLAWLRRLRAHVRNEGYNRKDSVLCGDFNVKFRDDGPRGSGYGQAHEDELRALMNLGFRDFYRAAHPDVRNYPGHTSGTGERGPNSGSRLHLILGSTGLAQRLLCAGLDVDSRPRKDAPPLVIELDQR